MADGSRPETDAERADRRAGELAALLDAHRGNVAGAHEKYPVRLDVKFTRMPHDEQQRFNALRREVSSANRAYWRAVRAACAQHREEDRRLVADHIERASKVPPHERPPAEEVAR